MSQPNAFSSFQFSTSSSPGLTFCAGRSSNERCPSGSKPVQPGVRRGHINRKSPSGEIQKGTEEGSFMKEPNHDEVPETIKTKLTTPSAVTGSIPCHFEGTAYFSKLHSSTFFPAEKSTKKEMHEKSESSSPSTQIVAVSRILKGIAQNPHFMPLKTYSNVAKKKLINAWDNIFEETVNKLLSMQITGFSADSKRLWETMEELEKMGYNVLSLRRRLVELTDVLIMRRRHKREILRLKNEAEQHRMEKNRLEFEIVKLKAKVAAENASVEDITAQVAKMEDEMPCFNVIFTCQSTKMF